MISCFYITVFDMTETHQITAQETIRQALNTFDKITRSTHSDVLPEHEKTIIGQIIQEMNIREHYLRCCLREATQEDSQCYKTLIKILGMHATVLLRYLTAELELLQSELHNPESNENPEQVRESFKEEQQAFSLQGQLAWLRKQSKNLAASKKSSVTKVNSAFHNSRAS
jgi:hypothetical protein